MSIKENVKKELNKILPPPVNSFMREINILKDELSRQRSELSKLREENRKLLDEVSEIRQEYRKLLDKLHGIREDAKMQMGELKELRTEKRKILAELKKKQMKASGQMFLTMLLQTALGSKRRLFLPDDGRWGMQPCMYYIVS